MPHHHFLQDVLPEIENELERLAINSRMGSQVQAGPYMQQPLRYSPSPYGGSGVGYGAPSSGVAYQQPGYVVQAQGLQPQMVRMVTGPPTANFGPGYVDSGDGQPAMIFGGAYEGTGVAPAAYQQVNSTGYAQQLQPGYQQNYAAASLPGQPQTYILASGTSPPPGYVLANSPVPQQFAPGSQVGLQPTYVIANPQFQQRSTSPGVQPAPQFPPQQPPYQVSSQTISPQSTINQFYDQSTDVQATSQPTSQQRATSDNHPPSYSIASQSTAQNASKISKELPQSRNPPIYQANVPSNASYIQTASVAVPQNNIYQPPLPAGAGTVAAQRVVSSQPTPVNLINRGFPSFLSSQDTTVQYEPVSSKVDTHHHALKALEKASQSPEVLSAIIGTYLALKNSHSNNHVPHGLASKSRFEVQAYNNAMDKLESLSADYISKHSSALSAWTTAMGPHRRHIFASLYNSNELVRAFCQEMPGGPLMLPELDTYALGTKRTNFSFSRIQKRNPNFNTSISVLSQVRTVVLIDDSGSMVELGHQSWGSGEGGYSTDTRWNQARTVLAGVAPLVAMHNAHGIDLHFLNRTPFYSGLRTARAVEQAFDGDRPQNGTPTGERVHDILDAYMCMLRYYRALMPLNLIVITDGEANDESTLHQTIEHHVTQIVHRGFPPHQFGIEFVQVGDCEYARRHLEKLEEEVSRHHHRFQRDVVGVTPSNRIYGVGGMDSEKLLAIAVSGIDARMNGYMRARGVNI